MTFTHRPSVEAPCAELSPLGRGSSKEQDGRCLGRGAPFSLGSCSAGGPQEDVNPPLG